MLHQHAWIHHTLCIMLSIRNNLHISIRIHVSFRFALYSISFILLANLPLSHVIIICALRVQQRQTFYQLSFLFTIYIMPIVICEPFSTREQKIFSHSFNWWICFFFIFWKIDGLYSPFLHSIAWLFENEKYAKNKVFNYSVI